MGQNRRNRFKGKAIHYPCAIRARHDVPLGAVGFAFSRVGHDHYFGEPSGDVHLPVEPCAMALALALIARPHRPGNVRRSREEGPIHREDFLVQGMEIIGQPALSTLAGELLTAAPG